MRKVIKIFKWAGLIFLGLMVFIVVGLALSIPLAKMSESIMDDPGEKKEKWVITNANVIPMDSNYILLNHSVFIENGFIVKVEADTSANYFGYEKVDADAGYLMPGLIDMHAHLFDRTDAAQFLSYGVTTTRNMMGFPMHLRWKKQQRKDELVGSRLITATPTVNSGSNTGPFHKNIVGSKEIPLLLKRYKEEGYDFVKIYDGLNTDQFEAIAHECNLQHLDFAGHPPRKVDLETLSKSGIASIEHMEEVFQGLLDYRFNLDSAYIIAKILADNKVAVCVNLAAYHQVFLAVTQKYNFLETQYSNKINPLLMFIGKKQMAEYPTYSKEGYDWTVKKYEFMEELTRILDQAGVPLIFGTDTGPSLTVPGETALWEIDLLQKAGLSNYSILESATKNAALVLNNEQLGVIKSQAISDFIILKENPLENPMAIKDLQMVVQGDTYYDKESLNALRLTGENKQSLYITLGNFLEHLLSK